MKKNRIMYLLASFFFILGCNKDSYKEMIITRSKEIELLPTAGGVEMYYGSFRGNLPTTHTKLPADIILTLNQDNTYKIKIQKQDECIIERGEYNVENDIILLNNGDRFELLSNKKIYKISTNPIRPIIKNYVLYRIN